MVDEREPPSGEVGAGDVDTGEPLALLAGLRQAPPPGFLRRVQGRIQRRYLAADAADFSFAGLACVALALLTVLFQGLRPLGRSEGDE
jgi:hypothetical protein